MWSSSGRAICRPNHTHCSIRGTEPVLRGGDFERQGPMQIRLICATPAESRRRVRIDCALPTSLQRTAGFSTELECARNWRVRARFPTCLASLCGDPRGQFPLLLGLVFSAATSPVPFAFQSPDGADGPSIRTNSQPLPFRANDVGNEGVITRFMDATERTSQRALTA